MTEPYVHTSGGLARAARRLLDRGPTGVDWQDEFLEALSARRAATIPAGPMVGRSWIVANLAVELQPEIERAAATAREIAERRGAGGETQGGAST